MKIRCNPVRIFPEFSEATFLGVRSVLFFLLFLGWVARVAAETAREPVRGFEASYSVHRDGSLTVEKSFRLTVDGEEIRRGPVMTFLTAYEGPGGLILDKRMKIKGLFRNDVPEPYWTEEYDGALRVYCGSKDVFPEPGEHTYRIAYRADGIWNYRDGLALAAFDILEPFAGRELESAKVRLRLPEGVPLEQYTPALVGSSGGGIGYEVEELSNGILVETVAPLRAEAFFFLNAVWPTESFATRSRWLRVMQQHPRIPLSLFTAGILLVLLIVFLQRARRGVRAIT